MPDDEIERRRNLAVGSDIATLIYTSGSTGKPKGCVLTHSNFVETLPQRGGGAQGGRGSTPTARRPCSSSRQRTSSPASSRCSRCTPACASGHQPDTKQLLPSLGSFKPTFLLAVPRVFEKVYNVSEQKAEAGGKGKIFRAAADAAVEHSTLLEEGKKVPFGLKVKFALFDRLVYSKLRTAMGGNVKYAVSGSAPLGPRLGHFYHSLGITILEGYGLTETTAPATVNLATKSKIGTVGPTLPGVSVRLADDGEIQVKGVDVFKEYWNNPEATAESFDGEWFKTGDIGSFDDDGFLTITGRKKEIIVTAGGKNVAPAALEDPIRANPLVGQVVVVGDKKPFISALVTLDPEMLPVWLNNNGEDAGMIARRGSDEPGGQCRGAARDRRSERDRVACGVDPQVHDPHDGVHRGERAPHAEDEHQAQHHPRGLLAAHRGDVLGCAGDRGSLDRQLTCRTSRGAPRNSPRSLFVVHEEHIGELRTNPIRALPSSRCDVRPSRDGRGRAARRGGRPRAAAPAP